MRSLSLWKKEGLLPGVRSLHFSWVRFSSLCIPDSLMDMSGLKSTSVQGLPSPDMYLPTCHQLKVLAQAVQIPHPICVCSCLGRTQKQMSLGSGDAVLANTTCVEGLTKHTLLSLMFPSVWIYQRQRTQIPRGSAC